MNKKVIIIGGGVAGLSSGIYGRLNGFETEIIEMHTITGGQCTAWERKGYRFDYCLHWLVGTSHGVFKDLWKETNVINSQTTILDHEIHSGIEDESGNEFIIYSNIDRWEKYLLEMAPEDSRSIRKMCRDMRKGASYEPLGEISGPGDLVKYLGSLVHMMPFLPLVMKHGKKTCQQYFGELNLTNPRLTHFINNLLGDRNFSALAFIMMLSWFDQKNAGYLLGGSLPLARRMEERYRLLGGKLTTGKRVSRVLVENNTATGVVLADGTVIRGDYVISAADGHSTIFDMLEGKYVSEELQNAYDSWELFTPLVQVSFGINSARPAPYPAKSFITKGKKIGSTELTNGYSLMNYSFDRTMAPDGKTVIVLRYESPWDNWKDLNGNEYKAEKERIRVDATTLFEKHYPGIISDIEVTDVATPMTTAKYTGVWKGAYEGFLPSAGNVTKSLKNTLPGLGNFYMAGQWLSPGGGIPPSVLSGKTVFKQICRKEKQDFRVE
jgi:phytoene dehydrogenase-like protein